MAEKDIFTRLSNLDYRYIYAITTLLVFLPLLYPVGVPMKVGDNVKNYAKAIDQLEPGSKVLAIFSGYATMLPDVEPIYLTTWKMLLEKDVKLFIMLTHVDCPMIITNEFSALGAETVYGKKYGEDYVIFPYISVTEPVHVSLTEDIYAVYTRDLYDNPLKDLTIMEGIKTTADVDLIISLVPEVIVRRYAVPFGIKIITWGTATTVLPFVPPYYDPNEGPVYGYVGGASQGAELEMATGLYGDGVRYNDAKNLGMIGLVLFIAVANVSEFVSKKGGRT